MKYTYLLAIVLISCIKEEPAKEYQPKQHNVAYGFHSQKDTRRPKQGEYWGTMTISVPGLVTTPISAWRVVRYNGNYVSIQWWSDHDSLVQVKPGKNIRYQFTKRNENNSCGNQVTVFDYDVTCHCTGDSLIETGIIRHLFYYEGRLLTDTTGTYTAGVKWCRKVND
jgi:hypothetical protein